ncbi:MAG: branched-chain amino acid ABC transporter permease [Xanthobacteraceae bacterium]|nr:branched-chain amino acid ABC transporter permease [Xanthobacteraceae bacterium]
MNTTTVLVQTLLNGLVLGSLYFLMAIGFTMVFGIMRVINFAHGEFYMIGAFAISFLFGQMQIPFLLALLIVGLLVGLLGVGVERLIFKPFQGDELNGMIASLGLSIIAVNVALVVFGPSPWAVPSFVSGVFRMGNIVLPWSRLVAFSLAVIVLVGFWFFIRFTKYGRAMRATVQDEQAAKLQGIDVNKIYPMAFGIGVCFAGIAGGIMGPLFAVDPFMGLTPLVKAFIVVIIGGLGSVVGAVVAGIGLGLFESFTSTFFGAAVTDFLQFALVIAVLLIKPTGLFGEIEAKP